MTMSSPSQFQFAHIGDIHRCDAEVESPEPEAAGAASDQAPAIGMADAAGEAAVFPGMVEVKAGIVAAGIVADPLTVVMDVRRFGMALLIAECRVSFGRMRFGRVVGLRGALHRAVRGRWPLTRNVTATNRVPPAPMSLVLRDSRQCKHQRDSQDCEE